MFVYKEKGNFLTRFLLYFISKISYLAEPNVPLLLENIISPLYELYPHRGCLLKLESLLARK